jgi:hypothetical protein
MMTHTTMMMAMSRMMAGSMRLSILTCLLGVRLDEHEQAYAIQCPCVWQTVWGEETAEGNDSAEVRKEQ